MSKIYGIIPLLLDGRHMYIDMSAYLRREVCGTAEYTTIGNVNWTYPEGAGEEDKNRIDVYMENLDLEKVEWSTEWA